MKTTTKLAGLVGGGAVALFLMLAGDARAITTAACFNYQVPEPVEPVTDPAGLIRPAADTVVTPLLSGLRLELHAGGLHPGLEPTPLPIPRPGYAPAQIIHAPAKPVLQPATTAVVAPGPEGGSTGAMLGLALGGLACWRKKLKG